MKNVMALPGSGKAQSSSSPISGGIGGIADPVRPEMRSMVTRPLQPHRVLPGNESGRQAQRPARPHSRLVKENRRRQLSCLYILTFPCNSFVEPAVLLSFQFVQYRAVFETDSCTVSPARHRQWRCADLFRKLAHRHILQLVSDKSIVI